MARHWPARAAIALALLAAGGSSPAQPWSGPTGRLERAKALVERGAFEQAATELRVIVSKDPADRHASELLAFVLESLGDLEGERRVRSHLARTHPGDSRILKDHGRVLERSGEEGQALLAYRRARELDPGAPPRELDAAIERLSGRRAPEVGTAVTLLRDPDAAASRVRSGAALPLASGAHVALLGSRHDAVGVTRPGLARAEVLDLSLVRRRASGDDWAAGAFLHRTSPARDANADVAAGGRFAGRTTLGRVLVAEWVAEAGAPWDEAAVALLHGGRSTTVDARLHAHVLSRRLVLQAGARERRLSVLRDGPARGRAGAEQSLRSAGVDLLLASDPARAVRGEILDERLTRLTTMAPAVTLAYRHYEVRTRVSPEFAERIALAGRGAVDELALAATVASPGRALGAGLRLGVSRDAARGAREWRAGGDVAWSPNAFLRLALGWERATEWAAGFGGERRTGWVSVHADL